MLLQTSFHQFLQPLAQFVLATPISFILPVYIPQIFNYPPNYYLCISPNHSKNIVIFGCIKIWSLMSVKSILISQHRMPEQTVQVRNHLLFYKLFNRLDLGLLFCDVVCEVVVGFEEIEDRIDSIQNNFGLQCHCYPNGRPPFLLLNFPQLQKIRSPVQHN